MRKVLVGILCFVSISMSAQKTELNKELIPSPVYDKNPGFVDLYWKAWELAWEKVKYQDGIPQSPYMDEGLWDDTIWIWDTEFMVLFCRYAPDLYPGIESLQNFYKVLLDKANTSLRIQHPDNPPFYSWVEYEYYKFTNDKNHLQKLLLHDKYLQRHFEWFESVKPGTRLHFKHAHIALEKRSKGYKWGGVQSGMDNTPRDYGTNGNMLWIDAIAQQALSALYIQRLATEIGDNPIATTYKSRYDQLKNLINQYYWNEEDGFYYDVLETDNSHVKVKTPASFWVLLAEAAPKERAAKMMKYLSDPKYFGGEFPWPTLSRQNKFYNHQFGDYWKGAIWLPTAYMGTKAIEKYGYFELAGSMAENLLNHMNKTFKNYEPHTIWECYSPSVNTPSFRIYGNKKERVREDFCGWSALGPISLFIENVLGFYEVDAKNKVVKWNKRHTERHGIERFRFGQITTSIIAEGNVVNVSSNFPFELIINGVSYSIKKGEKSFEVDESVSAISNKKSSIKIYPNPAGNKIKLCGFSNSKPKMFSINSISGECAVKGTLQIVNGNAHIETSTLKSGNYILHVENLLAHRFVK